MSRLIDRFESFTRDQILSLNPGAYGDYELLDVAEFFEEADGDDHRAAGVYELILRSPDVSEMVAYYALYEDLANYYLRLGDCSQTLAWNYAYIAIPMDINPIFRLLLIRSTSPRSQPGDWAATRGQ